jgi:polynucleotide 5'-hydroxyl-kinase GRC3/NOL9
MRAFSEFLSDKKVLDALRKARSIMVIGEVDTGKTTLASEIARRLHGSYPLGICDLDVGQSSIGPPTTVCWGKVKEGFSLLEDIPPEDFFFTGTLSPEGNLLPCITGAKIITQMASLRCEKIIIDTTGYLSAPPARALKEYKIDLLAPDIVIGIEKRDEISSLLAPFSSNEAPRVFRIWQPPQVRQKTMEMRAQFREKRFLEYFAGAVSHLISLRKKRVRFTRQPVSFDIEGLIERIVSFRDGKNRDIALGIIEEVDRKKETFLVKTPLKGRIDFTTLMVGVAKLSLP